MMRPLIKLRRPPRLAGPAMAMALAVAAATASVAQQVPHDLTALRVQPARFAAPAESAGPVAAARSAPGWPDGVATAGLAALALAPDLLGDRLPYETCAPCDSTTLWGVDRSAIGLERGSLGRASYATLAATAAGAGLLLVSARRGEADAGAGVRADLAVLVQALAADAALSEWLKVLVQRARPVRYTADALQHPGADAGRSFPSTHASLAFTAATAATTMLVRRGAARGRTAEIVGLFGAAALTAGLRVAAHRHFPTDALAGAALGALVGWSVPRLRGVR